MKEEVEKGRRGQSFDDFLKEEGMYEEVTEYAIKKVIAFELAQAMKEQGISKTELARRLETSRSQLDRLLDPNNDGVSLNSLQRAAKAVGRSLQVRLV